jgi:putative DNA primase/helicase
MQNNANTDRANRKRLKKARVAGVRQSSNQANLRAGTQPAKSEKAETLTRIRELLYVEDPFGKKYKIKHPNETLEAALKFHRVPWSILPVKTDGSKAPAVNEWKPYQSKYATIDEILEWFDTPTPYGIGIAHGILSGGSEAIDVDDPELVEAFEKRLEEIAPGLLSKLNTVRTPRDGGDGGRHYYYTFDRSDFSRYGGEDGNQKLAEREICLGELSEGEAKKAGARRKDDGKYYVVKTLIETRGVGGYTIAPGSPAKTHPTGKPYEWLREFTKEHVEASRISFDERATLLEVAHSFNEYVNPKKAVSIPRTVKREDGDIRPGEAYDQSPEAFAKTLATLEKHGWKHHSNDKLGALFTRPGKHTGVSARLFDSGLFYVFSSNAAPFEPEQAYTSFGVLIELEYKGDASACARALSADGFGERPKGSGGKATDNAIAILDGKLKFSVEPAERGKVKLTARDASGAVVHRDVINLDKQTDRDAFVKELSLTDDERKAVQQAMLKIADTPITPREDAPTSADERVMSKILSDGRIIEQLAGGKFAVYDPQTDTFDYAEFVEDAGVIYKPSENTGDMFLPDNLTEYGTEAELDRRIEEVYRRYCDAPDRAIKVASKYVRMTYITDLLNEVPYLKAVGEPGSGKSRFCAVGVSMSYHPVSIVSITQAVLFRLVDECNPSLFIDEFNPKAGGEDIEGIMQVLLAGFQRTAKVYRTEEPDADGKRKVRSYSAFGAKYLAGLKATDSPALESRCFEVRLQKTERTDIPFRTSEKMKRDCAEVSSMLTLWRLRRLSRGKDFEPLLDAAEADLKKYAVDPRDIQIATPLYALIEDEELKRDFADILEKRTQTTRSEKLDGFDGKIVKAVYDAIYDDTGEKAKPRRLFDVGEPIYEASTADIKESLSDDYPDLKDGYIGKKLTELGFTKAALNKRSYNGKPNEKRSRSAVVFDPDVLKKVFGNYGLPLAGDAVPTQPDLVEIEDQIPFMLDEHPEAERRKKGR